MKYGLDVSTHGEYFNPRTLADLAGEAEEAGWDGFFVQDVLLHPDSPDSPVADPWVALAAIATQTKRIRIGDFMTPLARRRPWNVARETASLDYLSDGRLIFGAGLGWQRDDFAAFGEEPDLKIRAEKLDEALEVLAGLWTGEPLRFDGKHYRISDVRLLPKPVQSPRIPVWTAGAWPNRRPFRRAARWDGTYVMTRKADGDLVEPDDIREILDYVKTHRQRPDPFDVAYCDDPPPEREKVAERLHAFAEAGLTWWLQGIWPSQGPLEEMRERIRSGPQRA